MKCVQIHLSFVKEYLFVKDFNIIALFGSYHYFFVL